MKREFALEPGGPKRLKITYPWNLTNAVVLLDGQTITSFATKADFQRGSTCKLPDGSLLTIRFGTIEGAPFLKGVHAIRNGVPLPGSAADPVPGWAWVFMIASALIPVISLGGALPAAIGVGGVSGTVSLSRYNRWSVALRASACAALTVACWSAFGLMILAFRKPTQPVGWSVPFSKAVSMSSSPEKLMDEIEAAYTRQGYRPEAIARMKIALQQNCGTLERRQSVACLRTALIEAQTRGPN
jgi:hypothetical protein